MLTHLAPARRRLYLAVGAVSTAAVVAVLALAGITLLRPDGPTRADQRRPGPVLLVPGYGGSTASLTSLAERLRSAGREVTVVSLPDGGVGDLEVAAQALADAAAAARERTGAPSVDVVGYSAGGVVARLWVTERSGAPQVRRLVTLGSPHHGTDLAELGALVAGSCPVACQQLAPGSPLLARLDAEPLPPGPVYLSVWTTFDDVVLPPDSAVLSGVSSPSLQSICPASRVRHGALPTDPVAQSVVVEALGTGPLPGWGAADCARLSS